MRFVLVGVVVLLVTYGQLIIKWDVDRLGPVPASWDGALSYLAKALMGPAILSGFFAAALGAVIWIAVLSRYELSSVYPLLSLNFLLVPLLAILLFGESLTPLKGLGTLIIVLGVWLFAQGT